MAHIQMLSEVGLLEKDELAVLLPALEKLRKEALEGRFVIHGEDVHSEVEERLGPLGKKVHTGRSRNDQVALDLMSQPLYEQAFCVEEVNRLAANGVPFRDAYRQVGKAVREGTFHFSGKLHHTHEGSIGNLCLSEIEARFRSLYAGFTPQKASGYSE